MQMINVNMISMNYENIYRYLCFCCADAVDCGAGWVSCVEWVLSCFTLTFDSSPIKGEGDSIGWCWLVVCPTA